MKTLSLSINTEHTDSDNDISIHLVTKFDKADFAAAAEFHGRLANLCREAAPRDPSSLAIRLTPRGWPMLGRQKTE